MEAKLRIYIVSFYSNKISKKNNHYSCFVSIDPVVSIDKKCKYAIQLIKILVMNLMNLMIFQFYGFNSIYD